MKYASRIARVFAAFFLAAFLVSLIYSDLFIVTRENILMFLLLSLPCLHLLVSVMRLIFMIIGKQYRRCKDFSLVKTKSIGELKLFSKRIQAHRFFFSTTIDGKERIVSGSFFRIPSFILMYKDPFDKLKTISPVDVIVKIIWILANVCVLMVIKLVYRSLVHTA
jgi:hypothetical protein